MTIALTKVESVSPPDRYGRIDFHARVTGAYLDDLEVEWSFFANDLLDVRGTVAVEGMCLIANGDEPADEEVPKSEQDRIKAVIGLYGLRLRATLNRALDSEQTQKEEA